MSDDHRKQEKDAAEEPVSYERPVLVRLGSVEQLTGGGGGPGFDMQGPGQRPPGGS